MAQLIFRHMRHAISFGCKHLGCALFMIGTLSVGATSSFEINFFTAHVSTPALNFLGGSGSGGGIGGPAGITTKEPVSVALVDVEWASCDKSVRYAGVQMVNTSSTALTIPISPDGAAVVRPSEPTALPIRFTTLDVIVRSKRYPASFVGRLLYGNSVSPASELRLLPGGSVVFRNITLESHGEELCGDDLVAEVSLSANQALKETEGYALLAREKWRVQSPASGN